jgi:hypothetical protein
MTCFTSRLGLLRVSTTELCVEQMANQRQASTFPGKDTTEELFGEFCL